MSKFETALPSMQRIEVRGVLFDMDGVLISSTAADELSWLRWARLHGMESTFSLLATHGRRTIDTVRAVRPDLDPDVEVARLEDLDAESEEGMELLPGVTRLIDSLPPRTWTVVTSASHRIMMGRLQAAGFAVPRRVVTADSVQHGKPHPEPYLLGASVLGLDPADCLVIEDAPSGIAAGKAAGCRVLAVATSHPVEELRAADWVVGSLEQVTVSAQESGESPIILCVRSANQK
jgi:sugar-phosphatase